MSSNRHPKTDGSTERVNITLWQLLRCFSCYEETAMLPKVKFTYSDTLALLRIEHIPFEVNLFGFSIEEPPNMLSSMRPSIPVSRNAMERLQELQVLYTTLGGVKATQG
jgi:hypothetical protein